MIPIQSSGWPVECLILGPVAPDQAEGPLQAMAELLYEQVQGIRTKALEWFDRAAGPTGYPPFAVIPSRTGKVRLPAQDSEHRLLECLQRGDTVRLNKVTGTYLHDFSQHAGLKTLRQQKNEMIRFAQKAVQVAIDTAVDENSAQDISDDWLRRVEQQHSPTQLYDSLHELLSELTAQVAGQLKNTWSRTVLLCQNYIRRKLYNKITLNDLARYTGKNPSYLSRQFKVETGQSVTHYIQKAKIDLACLLLTTYSRPIQDVAILLAFSDQAHFTRAFRQVTGTTPLQYVRRRGSSQVQ